MKYLIWVRACSKYNFGRRTWIQVSFFSFFEFHSQFHWLNSLSSIMQEIDSLELFKSMCTQQYCNCNIRINFLSANPDMMAKNRSLSSIYLLNENIYLDGQKNVLVFMDGWVSKKHNGVYFFGLYLIQKWIYFLEFFYRNYLFVKFRVYFTTILYYNFNVSYIKLYY